MSPEEEKSLLERIHSDPKEFGLLFEAYYKPIFGYIFRRLGDYDISRDIASETFLKAFLRIGTFKWIGISISSWLYRIATNEMNMYFWKEIYSPASLNELMENNQVDFANERTSEEEKAALQKELKEHDEFLQVQRHLKTLDIKYQEVIALRY